MFIERKVQNLIKNKLSPGKVLVLLGARRVGKTFLLKEIITNTTENYIFWNGEDFAVHELLKRRSIQNYKNIIGNATLLIIDEGQKIPEAGLIFKLIVDSFEDLKIIVTGSSAFDITNLTGEPLTGRKIEINIFPVAESEFHNIEKPEQRKDNLMQRMIWGNMPEIINLNNQSDKEEYLRTLINSYLLKDVLAFENLRNSSKLFNLLKLIAFQIGSEVSIQELGRQLAMSKNTIEKYLDILSKVFVIYKITGFSRNLRKEIVKNSKWYFYDNGIRNAIVADFNHIENRIDKGILWENYMMSERIKYQSYNGIYSNRYFWRTYDKQEIDLIEEREGKLFAYEFKWNKNKDIAPTAWRGAYPESEFQTITKDNYLDWII